MSLLASWLFSLLLRDSRNTTLPPGLCAGFLVALFSLPYFTWLSGLTFVTGSARANNVCKAVLNQAFFAQFMNALFLSYMAMWTVRCA